MISNEINAVIDNLCGKLGVAKDVLVPEMARMCFTRYLVNSIFCFVLLVIAAVIIYRCVKFHGNKKSDWEARQNAEIAIFVCCLISVGIFIGLWINVCETIQWYAAPTSKTFEYILTLL